MSYELIEVSRDDSRPIELYQISYTSNIYRWTSSDVEISYLGEVFSPVAIKRGEIEPTAEVSKANLSITVSEDSPLGEIFRISPPSEPVIITIFQEHYEDNDFKVVWKGRISNSEWKSGGVIELSSESNFASLQRVGPRRRCQAQCSFVLYDPATCGVDRENFREDTTVLTISGLDITTPEAAGKIDSWYAGGFVTWVNNVHGNTERRMVRASESGTGKLTLSALPVGLAVSQELTMYAGCSHTQTGPNGCIPKFFNGNRYGGMPYQPTKKPFSSTIY
jgi:hypothetical protein